MSIMTNWPEFDDWWFTRRPSARAHPIWHDSPRDFAPGVLNGIDEVLAWCELVRGKLDGERGPREE